MRKCIVKRLARFRQQQLDDASLPKLVHILHNVLNSCEKMCAYVLRKGGCILGFHAYRVDSIQVKKVAWVSTLSSKFVHFMSEISELCENKA